MRRTNVYDKFKRHEKEMNSRNMDELCENTSTDFRLQAQQDFLQEYITQHRDWKNLLMYHMAGSGKTCTAITMAERYKQLNPNARVTVILPARLKTNFIDELISPCGMEAYISAADLAAYLDSNTPLAQRNNIRRRFTSAITEAYNIITFDAIRRSARQARSLVEWAELFTRNRLLIVDEVHNLVSDEYKEAKYDELVAEDRIEPNLKSSWAMLFRFLNEHAHPTCKMLYLTASPIFDNLRQLRQVVLIMAPEAKIKLKPTSSLSQAINYLRGKVSYFPGTSVNAFPQKEFEYHSIKITKPIDELVFTIIKTNRRSENDENSEAFMILERQALVSAYTATAAMKKRLSLSDMEQYAPKVMALLKELEKGVGKHVVYSSFIETGLKVVEMVLRLSGWRQFGEDGARPYKTFCVWDGSLKDADKGRLKTALNHINNIDGKVIRVVLGSPSIREGVSYKHIQHMHMLDPVWNGSAQMQVEARAIRFCSHIDIPPSGKDGLRRAVVIHYYKAVPMSDKALVLWTADQKIYETIIPAKKALVKLGESALQKVSIDYYLFRKMYRKREDLSPMPSRDVSISPIHIAKNVKLSQKWVDDVAKKQGCGRAKVSVDGTCPEGLYLRANKQGTLCCYKTKPTKKQSNTRS
jgi:hypothetical protein